MTVLWAGYGLALFAALLLSAFFSGSETGMYCVNRVKLHARALRQDRRASRLTRFLKDEPTALGATLTGNNLCNYVFTAVTALFFGRELGLSDRDSQFYTTLVVTPIVFAFGEVVPKNLFRVAADRLMYWAAAPLIAFRTLLLPAAWVVGRLGRLVSGVGTSADAAAGARVAARRRVTVMLREGLIHAGSDADHFDIVERVLTLSHTPVHAVMVPRNRIVSVAAGSSRRELMTVARKHPYTRVPVYGTDPRHIIGRLRVDEALASSDHDDLRGLVRPVLSLRPHDTVSSAIVRMQHERQPIAIVTDRAGQLLGLVTLKDLMEEIVGELAEW